MVSFLNQTKRNRSPGAWRARTLNIETHYLIFESHDLLRDSGSQCVPDAHTQVRHSEACGLNLPVPWVACQACPSSKEGVWFSVLRAVRKTLQQLENRTVSLRAFSNFQWKPHVNCHVRAQVLVLVPGAPASGQHCPFITEASPASVG